MVVIYDELDENFEDSFDADYEFDFLFDNSGSHKHYLLVGRIGLWDGVREGYSNRVYGSLKDAILGCADGMGSCYIKVIEEKYGRLFVEVIHHDGRNYLEVRELTRLGEDIYYTSGVDKVVYRHGATRNVKFSSRYM